MAAVVKEQQTQDVKAIAGAGSKTGRRWCGPGVGVKVTAPGHTTGVHPHQVGAYLYILKSSVIKAVRCVEFGTGESCHPPIGDEHGEAIGPNGPMAYVSQRRPRDLMAAFLDRGAKLIHRDTLQQLTALMGEVFTTSAGASAWNLVITYSPSSFRSPPG